MHLARHIEYWSEMRPDAPAVTCESETLCWADLNTKAGALASELTALGAARGDRIGCMMPNNLDWAQMIQGYWNNPEKTEEAFDGQWYLTGDIGLINDDGSVVIVDRKKSMIISGGVNVYPAEVEKVLTAKSLIGEAAVFELPTTSGGGKEVVAIIATINPLSEADIITTLKEELGRYKAPKRVCFTTEPLPRTATGKIDRLKLPECFEALENS